MEAFPRSARLAGALAWYILIHTMFLLRVTDALDAARVAYALAGGYAVALHGAVRGTVDIDLVIRRRERDYLKVEQALHTLGLRSRLPLAASEVFKFRSEYIRNRNLIAWTFVNPAQPSEIVDLLLLEDLTGIKVTRIKVGDRTLRVASIADMIRMKRASGRPQDNEDVKALEKLR